MEIIQIVEWVVRVLVFIAAVITTIVSIVTGKKNKKNKETIEAIDSDGNKLSLIISQLPEIMSEVGSVYNGIVKEGVKAGILKEETVLNKLERMCREENIPFNSDYWKGLISKIVAFSNSDHKTESNQLDDSKNIKFEILGGNK